MNFDDLTEEQLKAVLAFTDALATTANENDRKASFIGDDSPESLDQAEDYARAFAQRPGRIYRDEDDGTIRKQVRTFLRKRKMI